MRKKAKLIKNGDLVTFKLDDGSSDVLSVNSWKNIKDSRGNMLPFDGRTNELDCEIEYKLAPHKKKPGKLNAKVKEIVIAGKTYTRTSNSPSQPSPANVGEESRGKAPYNFVGLNNQVKVSESQSDNFDTFENNSLSGYIDLKIETLTPLFVQGEKFRFFRIDGEPHIPGSSLRGMVRTLMEVMSHGYFKNFTDRHIYERKKNNGNGKRPGFLYFDTRKKEYIIHPGSASPEQFNQTTGKEFCYEFEERGGQLFVKVHAGEFPGSNVKNFKFVYEKGSGSCLTVGPEVIKSYESDDTRNTSDDMADLLSQAKKNGDLEGKYKKQPAKTQANFPFIGVPVWYHLDGIGEVDSFGHCKNYRVPYEHSISGHIPDKLIPKDGQDPDIVEVLFGTIGDESEKIRAGKVYFEDAKIDTNPGFESRFLQILASPKPKAAGFYLQSKNGKKGSWNTKEDQIRGYKLYWHRDTDMFDVTNPSQNDETDYEAKDQNWRKTYFSEKQAKSIELNVNQPFADFNPEDEEIKIAKEKINEGRVQFTFSEALKPGAIFLGKIRFDNLSKVELGGLLSALNLPKNCCHKIGMGKPIGLGSIKINTELTLINREKRYKTIFEEEEDDFLPWNLAEEKESPDPYTKAFAEYVYSKENIWDDGRMKELQTMLTYDAEKAKSDEWIKETRYMNFEETRGKILPTPTSIANGNNDKI